MAERIRPKISITLDADTLTEIDAIAERFGENRSRILERLVADGVWQHRHIGKSTGSLPEIMEVYRRVVVYKDHYEMGGMGLRMKAYELRWEELPLELQAIFPPNANFAEWRGTIEMLKDEREALEHTLESIKGRLAEIKSKPEDGKRKGGK